MQLKDFSLNTIRKTENPARGRVQNLQFFYFKTLLKDLVLRLRFSHSQRNHHLKLSLG